MIKIRSAVVVVHIAAVCLLALMQGCITNESQGSGRGAGAKHKLPWRHEHRGNENIGYHMMDLGVPMEWTQEPAVVEPVYESIVVESEMPPKIDAQPTPPTELYIVQKGDVLSQLALDFDTTTSTLVELNHLPNPDVLYVGQALQVPVGRRPAASAPARKENMPSNPKKGGSYTIRKGDTLSEIALSANVSIDDLRTLNRIESDMIYAGQKIDIPSYGKVPGKSIAPVPKPEPEPLPGPVPIAYPTIGPIIEPVDAPLDMVEEHMVYPGETLDDIARQHSVGKADILRSNPQITGNESLIEGSRLRIPLSE